MSHANIDPDQLTGQHGLSTARVTCCDDCGREYGDQHGFPDLVVSNDVWRRISPHGDGGGLLCPSCICKRLYEAGIKNVEAAFMSGPIQSVTQPTMYALRRIENLQERLDRMEQQGG